MADLAAGQAYALRVVTVHLAVEIVVDPIRAHLSADRRAVRIRTVREPVLVIVDIVAVDDLELNLPPGGIAVRVLGLEDDANDGKWQSLYHFTVGGAVEDDRLATLGAYHHLEERRG